MKNLKKNSLFFIGGFVISFAVSWGYSAYFLRAYRTSDGKIVSFNPYQYQEKSKLSVQYFYTGLPRLIQMTIQNRKMSFDYLTACEGNFKPSPNSGFAVSFFDGDKPHLDVFDPLYEFKIKSVDDISKSLDFKKRSPDDYFEIQCPHAALAFNRSSFHAEKDSSDLIDFLKRSNENVIQLKTKKFDAAEIFAYDDSKQKFIRVGTVDSQ